MGSTISKTTLHNEDYVVQKDLRKGDTVAIKKAGDVIPEVVRAVTERRNGTEEKFEMMKNCPICNSPLIRRENEAAYYCVNPKCDARKIEGLCHFVSRDAMYIDGFGDAIIEDFYNMGYLKSIVDFYNLYKYKEELMELEGFGSKSITNLLTSIENSKKNSLERLLFALGIRHVGKKSAKILASHHKTLDNIINATYEELIETDNIGDIMAKSIKSYFSIEENIELINQLKQIGVNMNYLGEKVTSDENFMNKTFVLTGSLSELTRDEAGNIIELRGGSVTSSVTKKTDVVIVGENPGSKYNKAIELGITIWNEKEFIEKIKEKNI